MSELVPSDRAVRSITVDNWTGLDLRCGLLSGDSTLVIDPAYEFVSQLVPDDNEVPSILGYSRITATGLAIVDIDGLARFISDDPEFQVLDPLTEVLGLFAYVHVTDDDDSWLVAHGYFDAAVEVSAVDPFSVSLPSGYWTQTR